MGNAVIPYCRKLAIWYLQKCDLVVSDEHSLGHHQFLITADIFVSVLYCGGNLWLLWHEGMDLFSTFLNLLCLLHVIFATCISRNEYFQKLASRNWSGTTNPNAFLRIIILEVLGLGINIWAIFSLLISPTVSLSISIAITCNIVLVLLDTIRVDLASMFDASPT